MLWEEKLSDPSERADARALVAEEDELVLWKSEIFVGDASPPTCPFLRGCRRSCRALARAFS